LRILLLHSRLKGINGRDAIAASGGGNTPSTESLSILRCKGGDENAGGEG
jgi:hypothetical protein